MARSGFYDENRYSSYPIVPTSVRRPSTEATLPATLRHLFTSWLVDARFTFYARSDFDPSQHTVRLASISRSGNDIFFTFAANSPDLIGVSLVFSRDTGWVRYEAETQESVGYTESIGSDSDPYVSGCEDPIWEGTIVTGDLTKLFSLMTDGQILVSASDECLVEPALLECLRDSYVESLNVATKDRGRVDDLQSDPYVWPHEPGSIMEIGRCKQGSIEFVPGFNCEITQSATENALVWTAQVGAGMGEPCGELPWFPGDAPPTGGESDLYSGSFRCDDVLRSLNGVGGPVVPLRDGPGVRIQQIPETNRIIVDGSHQGLATCLDNEAPP